MARARFARDIEDMILSGLGRHLMNREIAAECGISQQEVRDHLVALCRRLRCTNKLELMAKAVSLGYGHQFREEPPKEKAKPAAKRARGERGMTTAEQSVLNVLRMNAARDGSVCLTMADIAKFAILPSPGSAHYVVKALEKRGCLTRTPHAARSITLSAGL